MSVQAVADPVTTTTRGTGLPSLAHMWCKCDPSVYKCGRLRIPTNVVKETLLPPKDACVVCLDFGYKPCLNPLHAKWVEGGRR